MGNVELPEWLKGLPLAPVFRPTDTEFADPIAYISKIEKEASAFGICKVIPPLPKPSKKYVFNNLNKSLLKNCESGLDGNLADDLRQKLSRDKRNEGENRAVFTTRQQELGLDSKRSRDSVESSDGFAKKQVWQSGEFYTLEQFESKSKLFSRSVLNSVMEVTPLVIEALFWKATKEKPIYIEYANDVPGSGFGEPEGLLNYFFGRKKRKNGTQEVTTSVSSSSSFVELEKKFADSQASSIDEFSQSSKQKGVCTNGEVEGSAGWKLSNCPWNLQVIARSAGSLTRYMLDDIPGVTSPMIYIGMLFSWFAWHVEDHELHSLNFLHTGSPKTWYAIPGEYAFAFEDVVCKQAYGGEVEHLAALKILGEKTTLLSPEIVVASGIPCCRLVQNPGEFVVTFPRAYHIGFSHGFNCGEAANFGTPQWLSIAKDAAVRRAVMDHLPMLSHQQLLYLLTMSFISRIPRSLLPGVRTSRLKNRLKEERELLVKKAFIEDMLKENHLLHTLLGKDSTFRAVLWHPDSLPSIAKDSNSNSSFMGEELSKFSTESSNQERQISHGNSLNDLYLESSDLSSDFQIDSGTLVCVACGILGYPIMSVVQPSKKAFDFSAQLGLGAKIAFSETNDDEKWRTFGFLRPRIFCLEHALQVEELLRTKGGTKMLVICHSDYNKIKANAIGIAEELKCSYNYKDVQFDSASSEELKLIDIATDNDQLTDFEEDWTSKLGINLRFSVKTRKSYLLNIDYSFSIMAPSSGISRIKWCSRKSRTKREPNRRTVAKIIDSNVYEKVESLNVSNSMDIKPKILFQYHRRKFRAQSRNSVQQISSEMEVITDALASTLGEESNKAKECVDTENHSSKEKKEINDLREENELINDEMGSGNLESKRKIEQQSEELYNNFIRSPCEGLRPRKKKKDSIYSQENEEKSITKKIKKSSRDSISSNQVLKNEISSYKCNLEGCRMYFTTRSQFLSHKNNKCHHKACGKRFHSHKYLVLHQRVHDDKRPLKCTWKGCSMTFKWAWARTEHLRLHTGERPYKCKIKGCGLTFRYVSDFSRHRRKTGHYVNSPPK